MAYDDERAHGFKDELEIQASFGLEGIYIWSLKGMVAFVSLLLALRIWMSRMHCLIFDDERVAYMLQLNRIIEEKT